MTGFDIEGLLDFEPAKFFCEKCCALSKRPSFEWQGNTEAGFRICPVCRVKYIPTEECPTVEEYLKIFPWQPVHTSDDIVDRARRLASISRKLRQCQGYPHLRALMEALSCARSFVHFVSYGITAQFMIGALKVTAQRVPVRGIVAGQRIGEGFASEITDYGNEAPDLEIRLWNDESEFRSAETPHQKLVVIDGLLAFKGSANLTLKAWRSAEKDMDMIETVTDVVEVIHLHNRYFSPVWAKVGSMGDDIVMSVYHV